MLALGTAAPDFALRDVVSGELTRLEDVRGKAGTLVMFLCRHCPFVKHLEKELAVLGEEHRGRDVSLVGISSNDAVAYPDDAPDSLREQAKELGFLFPYLYDETQELARAYDAKCTPEFFLFDKDLKLVYRGQFDDSRPGNGVAVTGRDVRSAIAALLEGRPVAREQRPSIGCSIKWK